MKQVLCTIYDSKAEIYKPPMLFPNLPAALRAFTEVAGDTTSDIGRYPEDFSIVEIGSFNTSSGELHKLEPPKFVSTALGLLKQTEDESTNITAVS